ncbi:hypothetical protein MPRS_26290 [Mycobacterium paraseoulense]|nr:hypothetical protein MPRS_26290 [Mycobacterium paraseoulense]
MLRTASDKAAWNGTKAGRVRLGRTALVRAINKRSYWGRSRRPTTYWWPGGANYRAGRVRLACHTTPGTVFAKSGRLRANARIAR